MTLRDALIAAFEPEVDMLDMLAVGAENRRRVKAERLAAVALKAIGQAIAPPEPLQFVPQHQPRWESHARVRDGVYVIALRGGRSELFFRTPNGGSAWLGEHKTGEAAVQAAREHLAVRRAINNGDQS